MLFEDLGGVSLIGLAVASMKLLSMTDLLIVSFKSGDIYKGDSKLNLIESSLLALI